MLALWPKKTGPVLQGNGLRLRLPKKTDLEAWQELRRHSRDFLKPYEPRWSELDLSRTIFENRVRRASQEAKAATEFSFFLFRIDKGEQEQEKLIGGLTLSNIRYRAARHANLGYWMGVEQAGRGHMGRAVGLCMPFAFSTLELRRVHAACLPDNIASRRVLEKNGFVEEGFAEQYLQIAGEWRDHVLYGLARQRFEAKNNITGSMSL